MRNESSHLPRHRVTRWCRGAKLVCQVPTPLANLAVTCPLAYSLTFDDGAGTVSMAQTVLFDGTSVVRQQIRAQNDTSNKVGADLKF